MTQHWLRLVIVGWHCSLILENILGWLVMPRQEEAAFTKDQLN